MGLPAGRRMIAAVAAGTVTVLAVVAFAVGALWGQGHLARSASTGRIEPSRHHVVPGHPAGAGSSTVVPAPPGSIEVTAYGADPTGASDATAGFAQAIDAAEASGDGTVYVPPGRYVLDDLSARVCELCIDRPIHLVGSGSSATTLVNEIGLKNPRSTRSLDMIEIVSGVGGKPGGADGTTISGLTLDSATYDAGTDIMDFANHTVLSGLVVHAATSTDHYNPNSFGIRVITVCSPYTVTSRYRVDNQVDDVTITGNGSTGTTELDLSCQVGSTVSNVTIDGNGMDIYICHDVTVDGATLTGHASVGPPYTWVMNDSSDIHLRHIETVGSGGVIVQHLHDLPSTDVTITDETMNDPTGVLFVGDAAHVTIADSTLGILDISPALAADNIALQATTIAQPVLCPHPGRVRALHGLACGTSEHGPSG